MLMLTVTALKLFFFFGLGGIKFGFFFFFTMQACLKLSHTLREVKNQNKSLEIIILIQISGNK